MNQRRKQKQVMEERGESECRDGGEVERVGGKMSQV